ncbi:MAG TPA: type II toxin-antitoxin system RelE/ParE family toxin [Sphingobacterium sp.]|nr:type II toxin-antitoxin system RelE/ParE family toxin [Sphingobacterium sp.]
MARRKIIWTQKANFERQKILDYWINRNKSKLFSIKLNSLIIEDLRLIAESPYIGRKTEIENIRVKVIRDYLLFYEILGKEIVVLTLWDGRRDPQKLSLK